MFWNKDTITTANKRTAVSLQSNQSKILANMQAFTQVQTAILLKNCPADGVLRPKPHNTFGG